MKASLFLMFAGASFALSSCQEAATPTATEPVAPSAPPIKVSLEKNEIGSVVYGGGIAPSHVKGKTIVFRYANGETRNFDYFNDPHQRTRIDKKGRTVVSGVEGDYVFYTKTSGSTAQVKITGSDGGYQIWLLTFDTPSTGTAVEKEVDYDGKTTVKPGITFTIN